MNKQKSEKNESKNQTNIEDVDFKGYQPVTKALYEERVASLVLKRRPKFMEFKENVMTSMVMADKTDEEINDRLEELEVDEVKNARDWLLGKGVAWQIQMAMPFGRLTRENVLSKEEFYSLALFVASSQKRYQKKELMVAGAHDMGYFSRHLSDVQVNPWLGCQAGIVTLGIQSNGNIIGCLALSDPFVEGNIRQRSLQEIWNDENSFSYARRVRTSDLGDNCQNCHYRSRCKGGCSAVSYTLTGKLHQGPYCLRLIEEELLVK